MRKKIIIIVSLLGFFIASKAEDIKSKFNPVQTAVISQSISPDAHAGGMGDIGAATEPDINSQAWNAAKYPFCISRAGVSMNYTPWLRQIVDDIDLSYLVGYMRLGDYQAVSGSLRYFSLGEVSTYDGTTTESETPSMDSSLVQAAMDTMLLTRHE